MPDSDISIDRKTLDKIENRVLNEEGAQLHYERPPSIINDLTKIIEEEITADSIDDE